MRHNYFGKKLSRTTDARKRLIRSLAHELIVHGAIRTTLAKAQAVRGTVEKLVTKARGGSNADRNVIRSALANRVIENMLLSDAKHRFAARTSGFTRIIKLGPRQGDATEEVLLSFVDAPVEKKEISKPVAKPASLKAVKKPSSTRAKKK